MTCMFCDRPAVVVTYSAGIAALCDHHNRVVQARWPEEIVVPVGALTQLDQEV